MKLKLTSVLAAAALLTACSKEPIKENHVSEQAYELIPGSAEDFAEHYPDRVYYGFDRSDISAEAELVLQKQAEWLKKYPHMAVVLEGHCDERGTVEYNLALGERRAVAAKKYLVSLGVEASRIKIVSYGKNKPVAEGHDEDAHAKNRVTITVVE